MRRMEGWERKVLKIPVCQQETRPMRKPGRNWVAKNVANNRILRVTLRSSPSKVNGEASASPLPARANRQATKMSRNLREK